MKVTVIINSFKRPKGIVHRAIKSVLEQIQAPSTLILVDQNKDRLRLDEEIENNPNFVHFHYPGPSLTKARNSAPIADDTEWIVFCDDDAFWDVGYFERFNALIADEPGLDVVAGVVLREDTRQHYSMRQKVGRDIGSFISTKILMGANFAVKKSVFYELGKFDERFGVGAFAGSSEETDFCWKAYFAGKRIGYRPQLIVLHPPPFSEDFRHAFLKSYRYGVGKGLLVKKWLFVERRPIVLLEWLEMFALPIVRCFIGLTKLCGSRVSMALGEWLGRFEGFFLKKLETE